MTTNERERYGRPIRVAEFSVATLLALVVSNSLFDRMVQSQLMREAISGTRIPVVGIDLSPAFLASSIVMLAIMLAIGRLCAWARP